MHRYSRMHHGKGYPDNSTPAGPLSPLVCMLSLLLPRFFAVVDSTAIFVPG